MKKIFECLPCLKPKRISDGDEGDSKVTILPCIRSSQSISRSPYPISQSNKEPDFDILGWGNNDYGQLGMGTEHRFVTSPTPIDSKNKTIHIAGGLRHTLYLTAGRKVYSCGSNDFGQLGQTKSQSRPSCVEGLSCYDIYRVYAGDFFSLALTENGTVLGWGSSSSGQLLSNQESVSVPMELPGLGDYKIIQLACGASHVVALDENGVVLVWGNNSKGQLGIGANKNRENISPTRISSINNLPIAQIFAGSYHSGVLTFSGAIFVWGRNSWGQLGLGDQMDRDSPVHLRIIRDQKVEFVACGEEHTVCLTAEGGVFSWGHGQDGQLGHGTLANQNAPRKIAELMGDSVVQIAAGRRHTIVLTNKRKILGFGLNSGGQLVSADHNVRLPVPIPVNLEGIAINRIGAAGDQSFIGLTSASSVSDSLKFQMKEIKRYHDKIGSHCSSLAKFEKISKMVLAEIENIFSHGACLNASFLANDHYTTSAKYSGLALSKCSASIAQLFNRGESRDVVLTSIHKSLIPSLPAIPADIETLRLFLILPFCFHFSKQYKTQSLPEMLNKFAIKFLHIGGGGEKVLRQWVAQLGPQNFTRILNLYKGAVQDYVKSTKQEDFESIILKPNCDFLKRLYEINEVSQTIKFDQFYLRDLSNEGSVLFEDYKNWRFSDNGVPLSPSSKPQGTKFSFCNYPFVYSPESKSILLKVESQIQQYVTMRQTQTQNIDQLRQLASGRTPRLQNEHLQLVVSRENIVQDTVKQIEAISSTQLSGVTAFHRPLLVQFKGEEARDANPQSEAGVRREFFMLVIQQLLDPKYGMIREDEESHLCWFSDSTYNENDQDFFLTGMICALAIYNDNIVDLRFPLALYKKLLQKPVDINDLKELSPSVGKSMVRILNATEEDCIEDWGLTFSIERTEFDQTTEVPFISGGENIPVTFENRQKYVEAYIDYVFNKAPRAKFQKFEEGFNRIVDNPVYHMFRAEELQKIVAGATVIDWTDIQKNAKYHEGYSEGHPSIKVFWAAFHELTEEEKRHFLIFLTGSSRVPLAGLTINIKFVNVSQDYLPVSHTCFNLLDLPPYKNQKVALMKLRQALATHSSGFQLV